MALFNFGSQIDLSAMNAPPPKKSGFFKKGGTARGILGGVLGGVGDYLAGNTSYADAMAQHRQRLAEAEEYQRRRQDELTDYEKKKEIEARFSGPDKPGLQKEIEYLSSLPEPQFKQAMSMIAQLRPQQFIPPPPVNLPYGATVEGSGAGPAPGTVEDGFRFKGGNPADPKNWEPVGGPSLNSSGGFR